MPEKQEQYLGYAWICTGYEDWYEQQFNHKPTFMKNNVVCRIEYHPHEEYWQAISLDEMINLGIPKQFIEFIPPYRQEIEITYQIAMDTHYP